MPTAKLTIDAKRRIRRISFRVFMAVNAVFAVWFFAEMFGVAPDFSSSQALPGGGIVRSTMSPEAVLFLWLQAVVFFGGVHLAIRFIFRTPW
ncbi:MAG: hypothetical protein AAF416_08380 [Pseudomonadota bacterium]